MIKTDTKGVEVLDSVKITLNHDETLNDYCQQCCFELSCDPETMALFHDACGEHGYFVITGVE